MPKKSGFLVFILSFVPGMAHLYVGAKERAIRFGLMFWGVAAINIVFHEFYWGFSILELFTALSFIYLPIVALIAMIDAFKVNNQRPNLTPEELDMGMTALGDIKMSRRTTATVLSIIPGLGHLYLGYKNQGLCFLVAFFAISTISNSMNISILGFILPVIWFYAIFDAWHRADAASGESWDNGKGLNINWHKWLGWGLIVVGVLSIGQLGWEPFVRHLAAFANNIGYNLDADYVSNLIRTAILAVVFVIGGIIILARGAKKKPMLEEDTKEEDEI